MTEQRMVIGPNKGECCPLSSWWLGQPPIGFTAFVEREHLQRMRSSRFALLETLTRGPLEVNGVEWAREQKAAQQHVGCYV